MTFIFDKQKTQLQLAEAFEKLKGREVVLFFSTGADAIASYIRMKNYGIKPILIYQYFIDKLAFVDNYIDYFEKQTGEKILKFPSELAIEYLKEANYQTNIYNPNLNISYAREKLLEYCKKLNLPIALGLRYTDGVNRIRTISINGAYDKRRFLPIADFTQADVVNEIKQAGLYVPLEYRFVGYSFERLYPTICNALIKNCPQSWKDILEIYPFAEAFQYNNSWQYYSKYMLPRIKMFTPLTIPTNLYDKW